MRMDPITLIVTALVGGASSALQDAASSAVKDAYTGLKSLLRRKLGRNSETEELFERNEREPGALENELKERLAAKGADQDDEIVKAAQELMKRIDPEGARAGKYNIQISGGKGFAIGDHQTVTMNFDESG
jgi:hypothetical protein